MRGWYFFILVFLLGNSCSVVFAHHSLRSHHRNQPVPTYTTTSLVGEINRLVYETDSHATVAIQIKSMKYGDVLYAKNERQSLIPASILKLFTAEAALLYLGPEYKYPTTLVTDARDMTQGVVKGNLYLVQSGDPSLTYDDLTDLLVTLKAQQIHGVNGNIYIDNTAYDQVNYGPGWIWNDKRYCYAAPINASIINHNCLVFKMVPAKQPGQLASIVPNPRYYYGTLQNNVVTKYAKTRSCYLQLATNGSSVTINGCMPKGKYAWGVSAVITDIMPYNLAMMQSLFRQHGIRVNGSVAAGAAPSNTATIAFHQSKPLRLLVNEMLKMSDNIIAGSMFKKMGELTTNHPGSWSNGSSAVKQILSDKIGLSTWNMRIVDGSGLSMDNRVQASQLLQVLDFAYHNAATNYEFISALPVAGVDGTLKHRLYNVSRKVRAKTGTMAASGVSSLAGYVVNKDKEPFAFVIIVNGRNGNVWKYRELEDKIVTALANHTRQP